MRSLKEVLTEALISKKVTNYELDQQVVTEFVKAISSKQYHKLTSDVVASDIRHFYDAFNYILVNAYFSEEVEDKLEDTFKYEKEHGIHNKWMTNKLTPADLEDMPYLKEFIAAYKQLYSDFDLKFNLNEALVSKKVNKTDELNTDLVNNLLEGLYNFKTHISKKVYDTWMKGAESDIALYICTYFKAFEHSKKIFKLVDDYKDINMKAFVGKSIDINDLKKLPYREEFYKALTLSEPNHKWTNFEEVNEALVSKKVSNNDLVKKFYNALEQYQEQQAHKYDQFIKVLLNDQDRRKLFILADFYVYCMNNCGEKFGDGNMIDVNYIEYSKNNHHLTKEQFVVAPHYGEFIEAFKRMEPDVNLSGVIFEALVGTKVEKSDMVENFESGIDEFIAAMKRSGQTNFKLQIGKMNSTPNFVINLYKWAVQFGKLKETNTEIAEFMKSYAWRALFNDDRAKAIDVHKLPYYSEFITAIFNKDNKFDIKKYE